MRTFIIIILAVCIGYVAAPIWDGMTKPKSSEIVNNDSLFSNFHQLAEEWRIAYNSKDAHNLDPLYAPDAAYISAHVDGYIAQGHEAVINNFQKGMDSGGYLDSIEVISVTASPELTTIVTRYTGLAGGQKVDGRNLLIWKNIDGRWKIVTHMTVVKELCL